MAKPTRSSLWADVVLNLALLTVLTIGLNAVLLGKLAQGREAELRATLATDLSKILASRVESQARDEGRPDPDHPRLWADALADVASAETTPVFAVLVTPDLRVVAARGPWPEDIGAYGTEAAAAEAARAQWLVQSVDLRAAITGERTERGEWQPSPSFLFGPVYASSSSPVRLDGRTVGAVRVVIPVGSPLLGPLERRNLPVLILSVLLSAIGVGAFGFFLFRRRILAPVEQLVASTKDVGEGHFDTRLPAGAANELGALAAAFNEMAAALGAYKRTNEGQLDELRAINDDLSRAREDLIFAEKMATVGRLAAGVAHEVGNPLASVIGFVELLQNDPDGDLADDLLPRIRAELDRIHRIIRDLLNYSRPTGLTHNDLEPIGQTVRVLVPEIVGAAAQLVNAQPRFAEVEFEVRLDDRTPSVDVPPDRLQQILLNLFVNAAEAMEGKGRIRVERLDDPEAEAEGLVTIAVEDEGPGIDPRAGSNIFEPFFTTKDVGDGTGLGLAVSLRLVEKMGGRLRHKRDRGGGACFHLSLPKHGAAG